MKNCILFLAIIFSNSVFSQITFTRSDYGIAGDKVLYAIDSPILNSIYVNWAGANQTWKFKFSQNPKRYDSAVFLSASTDPNAPGVTTNLLMRTVGNGDVYQEVTNSFLKQIQDLPKYKIFGVKLKSLNFPLTYLTTCSDSTNIITKGTLADFGISASSFPIQGVDSVRIEAKINSYSICDGWGTLTLPDSSVHNSLGVKTIITINANIFIHLIIWYPSAVLNRVEPITSYQWYEQNSKNFIANATFDTLGNITSFASKVLYVPPKKVTPQFISVSPDSAMQGQTINVSLYFKGTHFTQTTANAIQIFAYSNLNITSVQIINDTLLTASIGSNLSSSTGWNYIDVFDPIAKTYLYLNNAFKITPSPLAPKLVSISPGFGNNGQAYDATIVGTRTHFTKGSNSIQVSVNGSSIGYVSVNYFTVLNDSTINCHIVIDSNTKDTSCTVMVSNSVDGNLNLYNAFSVVNTGFNEMILTKNEPIIFPNPANVYLTISFNGFVENIAIKISDITGRTLKSFSENGEKIKLDVSDLQNGIYFVTITVNNFSSSKKIIINR
ncbi:MAG: T9SS type A sorting domain-containing protein [Bacteroidota bacterium]